MIASKPPSSGHIPDWHQQIIDSANEVGRSIDSVVAVVQGAVRSHESTISQILLSVQRTADRFRTLQESSTFPVLERIAENVRKLPLKTQAALTLFGEHGWYVDFEMSLPRIWNLSSALSNGDIAEAEQALVAYYDGRNDEIEKSIIVKFPERKKLVTAAFNAHRRGEYELSIPVLLAQTDGICKEAFGEYLFRKYNKRPRTAIYVASLKPDVITGAILSPLTENLPIGQSEDERNDDFNGLNRHMVIHGESLNYGTQINGLKAISLINYVAQALQDDDETLPSD